MAPRYIATNGNFKMTFLSAYILPVIIFLIAVLRILTFSLEDHKFLPVNSPIPPLLESARVIGLFLAMAAPLLAIAGCFVTNFEVRKMKSPTQQKITWFLTVLSVLVSVLEFGSAGH